jgi:Anthrone oxygenase
MFRKLLRFTNLFVTGVNTGIALSHALQAPQKAKLDRAIYLAAQQNLYLRYGRAASALEPGALVSSLALAVFERRRRGSSLPMLVSAGCVVAEIAVWKTLIDPINRQVAGWDPDRMPPEWPQLRDRWHALHRVRALLTATALGASIVSTLRAPETKKRGLLRAA